MWLLRSYILLKMFRKMIGQILKNICSNATTSLSAAGSKYFRLLFEKCTILIWMFVYKVYFYILRLHTYFFFQDWMVEALNVTEITTIYFHGNPVIQELPMPNGIGSMLVTIVENVAWIWSVSKLKMNMNGLNKEWVVSMEVFFYYYYLSFIAKFLPSIIFWSGSSQLFKILDLQY